MKIYHGERTADGSVVRVSVNGVDCALPLKLNLRNHSPTGFEWGYGGSGAAQLALAICANALRDDERAVRVYQAFKWRVIAPLQSDSWRMTGGEILDHVSACEAEASKQLGAVSLHFILWCALGAAWLLTAAVLWVDSGVDAWRTSEVFPERAAATIERRGAEGEIERNEAECRKEARPGHAVYVVTRWGLLRGCLLVPESGDPRNPGRHRFVWKEPPL